MVWTNNVTTHNVTTLHYVKNKLVIRLVMKLVNPTCVTGSDLTQFWPGSDPFGPSSGPEPPPRKSHTILERLVWVQSSSVAHLEVLRPQKCHQRRERYECPLYLSCLFIKSKDLQRRCREGGGGGRGGGGRGGEGGEGEGGWGVEEEEKEV